MKTAVVILPGRGTYNKSELGYLHRHFPRPDLLAAFDASREDKGQRSLSSMDGALRFSRSVHGQGENVSSLIFASSFGDFLCVDRDEIEIVAVTGNSMGWYTTLTCAGALEPLEGCEVVYTMATLMQKEGQGGQLVYPHMGPDWSHDSDRKSELLALVQALNAKRENVLCMSIDLGGQLVLAGNEAGLTAFEQAVPKQDRFPMRLPGHVGFHSPLVADVSDKALDTFSSGMFKQPKMPMIDGRGQIWWPGASDPELLKSYTFGHQVVKPYSFTRAIEVAAKEFAPDLFLITGPGTTLGGAVAQSLIQARWQNLASKADFTSRQQIDPLVVNMGMDDQRAIVA